MQLPLPLPPQLRYDRQLGRLDRKRAEAAAEAAECDGEEAGIVAEEEAHAADMAKVRAACSVELCEAASEAVQCEAVCDAPCHVTLNVTSSVFPARRLALALPLPSCASPLSESC